MSNIFGKKPVPASVMTEVLARAGKKGIEWSAKRFPWIELTSLCDGCGEGYTILSSLNKVTTYYESSFRPKPVVTEVRVVKQGELGTTRKAVISLTAYTDEQLTELQKCYFIPGMGCRVEWGWSLDATNLTSPPATLGDRSYTDAVAICAINSKAATNTHYSGIQGMVANFSYNLTRDNAWECSIEVIAAAEGLGGGKVNDYCCPCGREYQNEENGDAKKVVDRKSGLYTFFKDLYDSFFIAYTSYRPAILAAKQNGSIFIGQFNFNSPQRNENGKEETSIWEDITPNWLNTPDSTDAFISWGTLEAAINIMSLPSVEGVPTMGSLSSGNMKLANHPSLESSDPRVCIVPGTKYASSIAKPVGGFGGSESAIDIDGDRVILSNILLNCNMLMTELAAVEKGDGTIKAYLTNVLRKVNDACGSLWDFEIVSGTEDCLNPSSHPKLQIIDAKIYEAAEAFKLPALAMGTNRSVLRDMQLEMKMTDSMKTQALYSNGAQQCDDGSSCGKSAFKGFGLAVAGTFNNLAMKKASTPPECICKDAAPNAKLPTFSDLFDNLAEGVSDTTVSACRSALIEAYGNSIKEGKGKHCNGYIMPFDFNFTLDGIGGFAFGQIVSSDRIPETLRNGFDWQVTSVEHNITPNDWTTKVSTVARPK